jgi:hypothetical protein
MELLALFEAWAVIRSGQRLYSRGLRKSGYNSCLDHSGRPARSTCLLSRWRRTPSVSLSRNTGEAMST